MGPLWKNDGGSWLGVELPEESTFGNPRENLDDLWGSLGSVQGEVNCQKGVTVL